METHMPQPADDAAETSGQKQARLRRERREAKLKSEGSSRLEKITKISGRQNFSDPPLDLGTVPSDPDEVDLSAHPSVGRPSANEIAREPSFGADMRSLLRAGAPQPGVDRDTGLGNADGDQMMNVLSHIMGGMPPGPDSQKYASHEVPPGLAAMLGEAGAMPGLGGDSEAKQDNSYGYVWRIVHAFFALSLGLYVTATSNIFSGKSKQNIPGADLEGVPGRKGFNLFLIFATVELMLQSSRMVLERKKNEGMVGGWMSLVAGFLPEPWRGYWRLMTRYAKIWATIVEDAMIIVFVVGCVAWWHGAIG